MPGTLVLCVQLFCFTRPDGRVGIFPILRIVGDKHRSAKRCEVRSAKWYPLYFTRSHQWHLTLKCVLRFLLILRAYKENYVMKWKKKMARKISIEQRFCRKWKSSYIVNILIHLSFVCSALMRYIYLHIHIIRLSKIICIYILRCINFFTSL